MTRSQKSVRVSVVYALPEGATEIKLALREGATVAEAIARSRIAERHPEADLDALTAGIFGRVVERTARLADGDRVELYRPLCIDPKTARRRRARRG
jgi:putative ubiquitin-RnfH superfamily antitoxin RatB of RatAB toxin-antitoxin module